MLRIALGLLLGIALIYVAWELWRWAHVAKKEGELYKEEIAEDELDLEEKVIARRQANEERRQRLVAQASKLPPEPSEAGPAEPQTANADGGERQQDASAPASDSTVH